MVRPLASFILIAAVAELLAQPVAVDDLRPPWVGVEDVAGVRIDAARDRCSPGPGAWRGCRTFTA